MSKETPVQDRSPSDIYSQSVDDGLLNVASNLGTKKARDPYSRLTYDHRLDRIELEDIYRCYWMAKAVDVKPWDMTREWRTFCGDDISTEQIKSLEEEERKVEASSDVREALQWASLYGGAGIVMHVDGQGLMEEPLDVTKVKRGQLNRLSPADRWSLIPASSIIDYNPLSPTYRTAEYYRVATDTQGTLIHRSRIIFFRGRNMPIRITRQLLGWGESDVQRWYKAITNNETLAAAIIEGVHQANIDVVSAKGLAQTLAMDGGDKKIQDRFMTMDYCKSLLNMAVIDGEDTLSRNAFPFSGLPEIKRVFLEELASATDIPVTRLLGSSPGGMNATGESDTRNYYDMIAADQENDLLPRLYDLDQVLVRSALGDYPESLSFEFNPLWQMTDVEEATLRQTQAQTLAALQSIGIDDYTLQKDAVELGLVKNLDLKTIEAAEKMDDFGVENGNEDFEPDTSPSGDDEDRNGDSNIDAMIQSLISSSPNQEDKKKDDGGSFNKATKTGRRYRETEAGNRVYKDSVIDEIGFKEEKHKRDKGKFSKMEGSGGTQEEQVNGTEEKLIAARTGGGPESRASKIMESEQHDYIKLGALLREKYGSENQFDYSKKERKKLASLNKEHTYLRSIGGESVSDKEVGEFKSWFGSSKITSFEGKALPMFHGGAEFDKFKLGPNGLIFFTDNEDYARDFVSGGTPEEGQDDPIYETYIKAENPFSARNKDHVDAVNKLAGKDIVEFGLDGFDDLENHDTIAAIKKAGFDAINMVEIDEDHGGSDGVVESLAVFDPKQIFITHFSEYGDQGYH